MRYSRITLTINSIPIHSDRNGEYRSTRLTVFMFGDGKLYMNDLKELLVSFTEEVLGYSQVDWWETSKTFKFGEAVQAVEPHEAKGLGFYKIECAYEDDDGNPSITQYFNAHQTKFGEELF